MLVIVAVYALCCVVQRRTPAQLAVKAAYWLRFTESLCITFIARLIADVRHTWSHNVAVAYAEARYDTETAHQSAVQRRLDERRWRSHVND